MLTKAGLLVASLVFVTHGVQASLPEIRVEAQSQTAAISPLLFGTNLHANDEDTLVVKAFVRQTGIRLLRWPDGTDNVDWKTGQWPQEENPDALRLSPLATFEGAVHFARAVNAELVCVLNPRQSPEYAAEWLRYARAIGFPVRYWVLGNEPYFSDSPDYIPVDQYADLARRFATALKSADPSIQFGIAWAGPWTNEESLPGRDEKLIVATADVVDFIDHHWYPGRSNDGFPDPLIIAAAPERLPEDIAYFRRIFRRVAPARAERIGIAYLEWDIYANEPARQSLADAIFYADLLGRFANSGVILSTAYNLQETKFGLIPGWCTYAGWGGNPWNGVTVRPKAYALQLWSRHMGDTLVSCQVLDSPTFKPPITWHPHINYHGKSAPFLVAYAGRAAARGTLSLMVINKHPSQSITAHISLRHYRPAPRARVLSLNGESYLAHNDGPEFKSVTPPPPVAVRVRESDLAVGRQSFTHAFPAHSITVIEFQPRRRQ